MHHFSDFSFLTKMLKQRKSIRIYIRSTVLAKIHIEVETLLEKKRQTKLLRVKYVSLFNHSTVKTYPDNTQT